MDLQLMQMVSEIKMVCERYREANDRCDDLADHVEEVVEEHRKDAEGVNTAL